MVYSFTLAFRASDAPNVVPHGPGIKQVSALTGKIGAGFPAWIIS
jgi:hypothetical protein